MSTAHGYTAWLQRAQGTWGASLDVRKLAPQVTPFLQSGVRLTIRTTCCGEVTGTLGVTTGPLPALRLMLRSNAHGSRIVLGSDDIIVAITRGHAYIPVSSA